MTCSLAQGHVSFIIRPAQTFSVTLYIVYLHKYIVNVMNYMYVPHALSLFDVVYII